MERGQQSAKLAWVWLEHSPSHLLSPSRPSWRPLQASHPSTFPTSRVLLLVQVSGTLIISFLCILDPERRGNLKRRIMLMDGYQLEILLWGKEWKKRVKGAKRRYMVNKRGSRWEKVSGYIHLGIIWSGSEGPRRIKRVWDEATLRILPQSMQLNRLKNGWTFLRCTVQNIVIFVARG